jgi:hypothetical protein
MDVTVCIWLAHREGKERFALALLAHYPLTDAERRVSLLDYVRTIRLPMRSMKADSSMWLDL